MINYKLVFIVVLITAPFFTKGQQSAADGDGVGDKAKFVKLTDPKYINKLLDQKLDMLREDFGLLFNKKTPNKTQVVANAFKLWNNDNSKTVEVISVKDKKLKTNKHVLEYLKAMEKLPYKSAEIKYGQYSFINNILRGPDGKYHGFIEFTQEFSAITEKENKLGKINETAKGKIEVIIEAIDFIDKAGKEKTIYVLFLGNMTIEENR